MAVDADGNFVVTYTRDQTATNKNVYAPVRGLAGLHAQFSVATNTGREENASVARNASGAFSIAYETDADGVVFRRYNAAGTMLGMHEIDVPADFAGYDGARVSQDPSVAINDDGDTLVAAVAEGYVHLLDYDTYYEKVVAQMVRADGTEEVSLSLNEPMEVGINDTLIGENNYHGYTGQYRPVSPCGGTAATTTSPWPTPSASRSSIMRPAACSTRTRCLHPRGCRSSRLAGREPAGGLYRPERRRPQPRRLRPPADPQLSTASRLVAHPNGSGLATKRASLHRLLNVLKAA